VEHFAWYVLRSWRADPSSDVSIERCAANWMGDIDSSDMGSRVFMHPACCSLSILSVNGILVYVVTPSELREHGDGACRVGDIEFEDRKVRREECGQILTRSVLLTWKWVSVGAGRASLRPDLHGNKMAIYSVGIRFPLLNDWDVPQKTENETNRQS